jgi:uncharacterized protein (TIGR01777 family)
MRIAVTGAGGFIGRPLVSRLAAAGHDVRRLVRRAAAAGDEIAWDPIGGAIDVAALAGVHAVVHLGGESIAEGRWTARRRARIRDSRVGPTRLLAEALATLEPRPKVFVSASASGIYGDRGDEWLDESSSPGTGFLAEVAREWEAASAPAARAGIRVVHPRTGLVLAPHGGALAAMLPIFRLGLGGPLGGGRQWWSWITLEDAVEAIVHAVLHDGVRGPCNVVAPAPARCADLARALGRALGRPALLPAPAFALRLVLGAGQADELLLASARVRPGVLERTGFEFTGRDLDRVLAGMLQKGERGLG